MMGMSAVRENVRCFLLCRVRRSLCAVSKKWGMVDKFLGFGWGRCVKMVWASVMMGAAMW